MRKILILSLIVLLALACGSLDNLNGQHFVSQSNKRKLTLTFTSDSTCMIKNIFYCDGIDQQYRQISINLNFKKSGNKIIVRNVNCDNDSCIYPPIIEIPIQTNSDCSFLNADGRKRKNLFDGRSFQSAYERYGLIPNIDIDTMYIVKRKILLTKKTKSGSIGFIFK